jgi:hypothetical protein
LRENIAVTLKAAHRLRAFGLGLLLLALPACGLSDYEKLMGQAQEREARFREEQKYLAEPVKVPKRKDKEDREVAVADVFFRPPKGIQSVGQAVPGSSILWAFPRRAASGDFDHIEMAFGEDSKDFANEVLRNYQVVQGTLQQRVRQLQPPGRDAQTFDTWEFDGSQYGYSVNILRGSQPPTAVIYVYAPRRHSDLSKVIDLSLESLAFGRHASKARKQFAQPTPWQLQGGRSS